MLVIASAAFDCPLQNEMVRQYRQYSLFSQQRSQHYNSDEIAGPVGTARDVFCFTFVSRTVRTDLRTV